MAASMLWSMTYLLAEGLPSPTPDLPFGSADGRYAKEAPMWTTTGHARLSRSCAGPLLRDRDRDALMPVFHVNTIHFQPLGMTDSL